MVKQAWRSYLASLHPRNYKKIKNVGIEIIWIYWFIIDPIINDFAYGNTGEDARFLCDVGSDYIHWTNTDIYYQSGEVAYPAIAPIPVYE